MQISHIDAVDRRYDDVVISPHFDDAAASCGGRIVDRTNRGKKVLIVTVFTSGPAEKMSFSRHAFGKLFDYDRRCAEDKAAMKLLGVDFIWLGYREFLFRNNFPLFRYWPCYRNTPSNNALSRTLSTDLLKIYKRTGCNNLLLPLGVGQHMDHQLVFQAGIHLLKDKTLPCRVIFYEDYPYIFYPYMLYYRMKITGLLRIVQKTENVIFKAARASAYRDAVELLSGTPSFKLGTNMVNSFYLLPILLFGLYTQYVMKTSRNLLGRGWVFSQEPYDISRTIDHKLDAIMAYGSQLAGTPLKRQRIKKAISAYSDDIGFPKGRFCERYGKPTDR